MFEITQGNVSPAGVMINSMGPPCQPEQIWNACEPAMTVIPNYLITGVLAILFGLIGIIWSIFLIERKHGGLVLMVLSFAMLLFGGGIFPPLIGMIGGLVGTRINKPRRTDSSIRALAVLWPWALILVFVLLFGQWIVSAISNELMTQIMVPNLDLVLVLLIPSRPFWVCRRCAEFSELPLTVQLEV